MKSRTATLLIMLLQKFLFAQDATKCHYPIHVSADSIMNIIIHDGTTPHWRKSNGVLYPSKTKYIDGCYNCAAMKANFDKYTESNKYDSAVWKCEDYLIQHLGSAFYCNYILMSIPGFGAPMPRGGTSIFFDLAWWPNSWENLRLIFYLRLLEDGTIEITYPKDIPDCNGLPDCGFIITKEKAIEIAKNSGFITDSSKYSISSHGLYWDINLAEDKYGQTKGISINIQTGKQSAVRIGQRID